MIGDEENKLVIPPLEEIEVEADDYAAPTALAWVSKELLNLPAKNVEEDQCDNIFYTPCHTKNKVVNVIMVVIKLGPSILKHPKSCILQWLNDSGQTIVYKQVMVSSQIKKYEDEVLVMLCLCKSTICCSNVHVNPMGV